MDTIAFTYEDQTDFAPTGGENTDFDCEAFAVTGDSIYLFTKQWLSQQTTVYALPKTPGNHVAVKRVTFDVDGLVTGAALLEGTRFVALSGYSSTLQPFVFLLYDYSAHEFFSGNKRKLAIDLPFHQVESIATSDGKHFQLTNEAFATLSVPAKFHTLDLQPYTENYLHVHASVETCRVKIYPNPVNRTLQIKTEVNLHFSIFDVTGRLVQSGDATATNSSVDVTSLTDGFYTFVTPGNHFSFVKE